MLRIDSAAAMARTLTEPIGPDLKRLLAQRRDQLLADTGGEYELGKLARFAIIEPGDSVASIERELNLPLITNTWFEFVDNHGGWLEAVAVIGQDGFGLVLLVPNDDAVDPDLLTVLREQATPALTSTADQHQGAAPKAA